MDKKRALEIFNLREDATKEAIVKRYNVLFKKFRYSSAETIGHTRQEAEEAYRLLMGLEYRDIEAERRKMVRQKHPNPLFKAFGIDQDKLSNFIYYNKWIFMAGALALIVVIYIIVSVANHVEPDLKVIFAGEISVEDTEATEAAIRDLVGAEEPQVQHIPISEKLDPSSQVAFEQKLSVEIMAGENDVFIVDLSLYRRLTSVGAFIPLDDRLEELGVTVRDENLVVVIETEDGESFPPGIYGVDVSDSPLLKGQGVLGETLIAVMTPTGENTQNAVEYIKKLVESVQ